MLEGNLMPAAHMLLAATDVGCERFVCAGSSEESGLAHPVASSPYAGSKTAASAYAQMFHRLYALPIVLLRPFSVYGPRQNDAKLIPYAARALLRGEPPRLTSGDQLRDFVYVKDVARGFIRAGVAEGVLGEGFDLGTGVGSRVRDVVTLLADVVGVDITPSLGALPPRLAEEDQVADPVRTRELLGWEARWELREGLEETVNWYRAA
jgi:nucleoside-diphosphate-sugar epimerase